MGARSAGKGRENGNRCTPASSSVCVPTTTNFAPYTCVRGGVRVHVVEGGEVSV